MGNPQDKCAAKRIKENNEGEAYAQRLEQAGVKVVATPYNGMIHGFLIHGFFQVITNPGNQNANGTIVTGTLRTVFSF